MSEPIPLSEDALIDATLTVLEQAPNPVHPPPEDPLPDSPTLDALGATRQPKAATICEHCPNSVWFASATEVKCYCRVMYLITWHSQSPQPITHCDGVFLGQG